MIGPDRLNALRDLQESEIPELISLRDERSRLQAFITNMQVDLEQQRSLLTKTLLDKDAVQKSLLVAKDELHRIAEGSRKDSAQIRLSIAAPDMDAWSAMEKRLLQDQDKAALTRAEFVKDAEVMESFLESDFLGAYDEQPDPSIQLAIEKAAAKDFIAYSEAKPDDCGTAGTAPSIAGGQPSEGHHGAESARGISPTRTPGRIRERRKSTELMDYLISSGPRCGGTDESTTRE